MEYYNFEDIVRYFYRCSLNMDGLTMQDFNFDEAFDYLRGPIEFKLAEHGLLTYKDFVEYFESLHGDVDNHTCLDIFTAQTNYINFSRDDVYEAILEASYQAHINAFEGMSTFEELKDILHEMDNIGESEPWAEIALFDRVIHAQHETGGIFDDADPDDIRNDIEEEYKELTGIG